MSVFRFWKPNVQRDIDDELQFHFEARVEELVARGMSPGAARAQAIADFGDVDHVRSDLRAIDDRVVRRRRRLATFDGLRQDLVYAVRSLRRSPAVSLTIIATLALGLGVNAAMFSLLDVIFLRPPAEIADADGLRRVWNYREYRSGGQYWSGYDYPAYEAIVKAVGDRGEMAIYAASSKMPFGGGEDPPELNLSTASASYFRVLGVRPAFGRFYGTDEERLDAGAPVVVISDRLWKREFGGDRSVLGRELIIARKRFTIIGVAPPRFTGVDLHAADAWMPMSSHPTVQPGASPPWYRNPGVNGFQVLLRPARGTSDGELEPRLTHALRQPGIGWRRDSTTIARLGSIIAARGPGKLAAEVQVAERAGGVAIFVLLIAFANVVNLLLARAIRRAREIAVRVSLGISPWRLVRLLVTESAMLAIVAAVAALVAASWGGTLLRELLMPDIDWAESPLHWRVLFFAIAAAVLAGVGAGLVPALQSRAPDLTKTLKSGAREGGSHRSPLRGFLVASQAALSVALIVGATLFVRSLDNVRRLDIGYTVDRLAFVSVSDAADPVRRTEISNRLLQLEDRLGSVPGVERVAYTSMRPKWGIQFTSFFPDAEVGTEERNSFFNAVSPGFFAATGTRVIRGRTFAEGAAGRSERAVLVNQTAVDSLWPTQDPLGRCIRFTKRDAPCYTIIGVTQTAIVTGVKDPEAPHVYLPIENLPFEGRGVGDVVLRIVPDRMASVLDQVRAMLKEEFPSAKIETNTMGDAMEPEYRPWKLGATLFTLFGVLAVLVAAIGVYSSVSYAVSQRTHEFGVRMALGATGAAIIGQVVRDGLRPVMIGIVVGIALAFAMGRVMASLLYGVSPENPLVVMLASVTLLAIAFASAFAPAWRARRSDPVSALRTD